MITYTVYNQSGGQAKTTITRDLAGAHREIGDNVLLIDLDPQDGSLGNYLGVDDTKEDPEADDLTLHLVDKGKGEFSDLIQTARPGIDVIPSHKRLHNVGEYLDDHEEELSKDPSDDFEYDRYTRLFDVIKEHELYTDYDALILDANAKSDLVYYLALYASRSVVIPAEPTRSGFNSIDAVKEGAVNFADAKDISIGRLATFPVNVDKRQNSHKKYARKIQDEYSSIVYFKSLSAFTDAEDKYMTVYDYLKRYRNRLRESEEDVLPKYRTLLAKIYDSFDRPLSVDTWEEEEVFTGDRFWGPVEVPFAETTLKGGAKA